MLTMLELAKAETGNASSPRLSFGRGSGPFQTLQRA